MPSIRTANDTNHQTLHRPPEDAVGNQSVTVYKQTGNAMAKRYFKCTVKAPYAESTPAWYRYFTVIIKEMTRVVITVFSAARRLKMQLRSVLIQYRLSVQLNVLISRSCSLHTGVIFRPCSQHCSYHFLVFCLIFVFYVCTFLSL